MVGVDSFEVVKSNVHKKTRDIYIVPYKVEYDAKSEVYTLFTSVYNYHSMRVAGAKVHMVNEVYEIDKKNMKNWSEV